MESIFENSSFDPCSDPSSFLSFSSLADLKVYDFGASSPEPARFVDWDAPKLEKQRSTDSGYRSDVTAESPSSSYSLSLDKHQGLSACLPIAGSARSSFSSGDEYPVLVTPNKQGPGNHPGLSTMASNRSSSSSYFGDANYPPTPSLTNKSSCDSFASFSTSGGECIPQTNYHWDERSYGPSIGGSAYSQSTMPEAGPSRQSAHRCVSNPSLSAQSPARHRPIVNRASMPSLKEEEAAFQSWSFEQANSFLPLESTAEDVVANDLDWVFPEKIGPDDTFPAGPPQPDWNSAAVEQLEPAAEIYPSSSSSHQFAWTAQQPTPGQDSEPTFLDAGFGSYSLLAHHASEQRPLTAPGGGAGGDYGASASTSMLSGVNMGMIGGSGFSTPGMLGVPQASMMTRRSHSSEGYDLQLRPNAPSRDLFAYTPQRLPVTPIPISQPFYTTEPFVPRSQTLADRRQQLSVQIIPPSQLEHSSYQPLSPTLPPTPQSAGLPRTSVRAVGMSRAGTQPLPTRHRVTVASSSAPSASHMSVHLSRAQSLVQSRESQAQHREHRVDMASASVMQPASQPAPQHPHIGGWDGPAQMQTDQVASQPVLTTAPLPRYHPMPGPNSSRWEPNHPGQLRPAATQFSPARPAPTPASAPCTPITKRRVSAKPSKARTPSSAKRAPMKPGGFSWGETTFINFTSDDAEKILTGVAPSGSQAKRRREEEDDDERGQKRSRSRD